MSSPAILAVDQGTTNSKAALVATDGRVIAQASRPMTLVHPKSGWAELDGWGIWQTVRETIDELQSFTGGHEIVAVAIANQRESVLLWDRDSGKPLTPCVIWQCRRSSERCDAIRDRGLEEAIISRTGLGVDPLFPAAKIAWLLDSDPKLRERAERGEVKAGTVDSWLIWNLTGGKVHATDTSNASRTQLMNLDTQSWDEELAQWFDVPLSVLPTIRHSDSDFGQLADGVCKLPAGVPIRAVLGDSHAALYGHGVREPGRIKVTLGTGSSLMTLTDRRIHSRHGLSSTVAWSERDKTYHALEGNISVSGQAAAFVARLLNLADASELSDLAETVDGSGGVTVIPALAGLGAPHWLDRARGQITGMTLATTPAHVARATLEAIALQINDVLTAMEADLGMRLAEVSVDGGAAQNDFLMQLLADLLDRRIVRPSATEITIMGVAGMAANAAGYTMESDRELCTFSPSMTDGTREELKTQWSDAISGLGS